MKPFFTIFFLLNGIWAYPQGCIAIRNLVGFGQFARPEADPLTGEPTKWVLNINQRYFNAHQAFNGDTVMHEKPYLVKTTQLYVMDIGLSRFFENGWSFSVNLPISSGIRTAWNPENFNSDSTSHTTRAFGIGDLRITAYKWLWDVSSHYRWNIQVGLGLKLPTGDYRAQDYFYKDNTSKVLNPVNAVIQPGDGGTGIIAEINTYYTIQRTINLYGNLFYLFNPRDQNGTSNIYGNP